MPSSCKGICVQFNVGRVLSKSKLGYKNGFKRCTHCEAWFGTTAIYCPCCKLKLRVRGKVARSNAHIE